MRKLLIALAVLAAPALAEDKPAVPSPPEIVAAAPKGDWTAIAASDLLVMDLAADAKGKPRRAVIQLMPAPFSQGWIENIRLLAAARWWDGTSVNRVQDNYVVQWGDGEAEDKARAKALPSGLVVVPESDYLTPANGRFSVAWGDGGKHRVPIEMNTFSKPYERPKLKITDPYGGRFGFVGGMPFGLEGVVTWQEIGTQDRSAVNTTVKFNPTQAWPVHCYGMVGVGRDMPPNTGSGAELYAVIGHAPRHLDRNIALVGRVIEGIEHLSSLPRGKGALGFYDLAQGDERVPILSVRIGSEVKGLPAYEYLSTESASFAAYADARANRRDPFFIRPAGGADICNIPVPVRQAK